MLDIIYYVALTVIVVICLTPQRVVDKYMAIYLKLYIVALIALIGVPTYRIMMEVL